MIAFISGIKKWGGELSVDLGKDKGVKLSINIPFPCRTVGG